MTQSNKSPKLEVADILRQHLGNYKMAYPLWPEQRKVVSDILNCRTEKLGGHIECCDHCGNLRITYHSCRNRHCPKCQHIPRERWLQKRKEEILPVDYFHAVFTLPHELNTIILNHRKVMLNILFKAVSKTLCEFGQNKLGGKLSFIAVLHTWDQKLNAHFHLHCLIPGGVVSNDGKRWIPANGFLFHQKALSPVFRGKFIYYLNKAVDNKTIRFKNDYQLFKKKLYAHKWVVNVRLPIKEPEHVLEYLARYTHRVAIANSRITSLKAGMVTFNTKDRKTKKVIPITISAVEFIRRFLLHYLPNGFVRIRHYGLLATRNRNNNLDLIRSLLKLPPQAASQEEALEQMMLKLAGIDLKKCPSCNKGNMYLLTEIPVSSGKHPQNIRPPNDNLVPA